VLNQFTDMDKAVIDVISIGIVVGSLMSWLPAVASLFSIVWLSIQIWESDTVKKLFRRK
jgi:hypothetical protein